MNRAGKAGSTLGPACRVQTPDTLGQEYRASLWLEHRWWVGAGPPGSRGPTARVHTRPRTLRPARADPGWQDLPDPVLLANPAHLSVLCLSPMLVKSSREAMGKSPDLSTSASHAQMGMWDQTRVPALLQQTCQLWEQRHPK